jgi:hypothetical protein
MWLRLTSNLWCAVTSYIERLDRFSAVNDWGIGENKNPHAAMWFPHGDLD